MNDLMRYCEEFEKSWASRIFWCFVIMHVLIWSILPELVRYTTTNDVIEAVNWARQLDWGYDKNPWMIGLLTRLGLEASFGTNFLGYYFIQQLLVGLGFWSVWQLGKQLFRPIHALIAVLILEGCIYFSTVVQTNNDNFALLGFLTFAIYSFFMACKREGGVYALLTGIFLGFAVMSKYSAMIIMPWMLIYFLTTKYTHETKRYWYGGLLLFLLICLPNIIWLVNHDFVAIRYIFVRQSIFHPSFLMQHLYYPFDFIYRIFLGVLPCLLLLLIFVNFKTSFKHTNQTRRSSFLLLICIGPLATIVFLSCVFGLRLYWEWGVPFVPLLGLVLLDYFQPVLSKTRIKAFIISVFAVMILIAGIYYSLETRFSTGRGSSDYPAQEIANAVTKIWWDKFHKPLRYVAGSRYVGGFVSFYSKDKPKVFVEWSHLYSPKVDIQELKKYGAVFVNDGYFGTKVLPWSEGFTKKEHFPAEILKTYPTLQILPIKIFPYHRNQKTHKVVNLLIGLLPPENK